jgi:hypothetical protein
LLAQIVPENSSGRSQDRPDFFCVSAGARIVPIRSGWNIRKRCELGQLALRLDFAQEPHGIIAGENSFLKQFRPVLMTGLISFNGWES